ncbi:MAG: hypothetical protein ACFBQW_01480 [Sphingomonadaceae bacterium]
MPGLGFALSLARRHGGDVPSPPPPAPPPPPPAFSPADLFASGEAGAWYDPSDLSSMHQDSAGTTAAVLDQPVGRIADKTGNGFHATQATSARRPILRLGGDGRYYLAFDGVDDFLGHSLGLGSGDATFAAAAERTAAGAAQQALFVANDASQPLRPGLYARAAGNDWGCYVDGAWQSAGHDLSIRAVVSSIGRASGDTHDMQTNGGAATSLANSLGAGADRRAIGAGVAAGTTHLMTGRVYGIVAIDRALGASELDDLVQWLAGKAGVAL